jgi:hypothetical protein
MSETTRTTELAAAAPAAGCEAEARRLMRALAEPFSPELVKAKPGVVKGNRCLVMRYVDARDVMNRLDDVLTPCGWRERYTPREHGVVVCELSCLIAGEWVTREDVGGESAQDEADNRAKAAYSDALKRAAVKFGVGRYLYQLKGLWADYDPEKRRVTGRLVLPPHALPYAMQERGAGGRPARAIAGAAEQPKALPAAAAGPPAEKSPAEVAQELLDRVDEQDARLSEAGKCGAGELAGSVADAWAQAGLPLEPATWTRPQLKVGIGLAAAKVQEFAAAAPAGDASEG